MEARVPASTESAPSPGPTVRSSRIFKGAGSAPARSKIAKSFAVSTEKLPVMRPDPPKIGERITGADITLSSSTIANGLPTLALVTSPNFLPPAESNLKSTSGSPVCGSKPTLASTRRSPLTMTRLRIT